MCFCVFTKHVFGSPLKSPGFLIGCCWFLSQTDDCDEFSGLERTARNSATTGPVAVLSEDCFVFLLYNRSRVCLKKNSVGTETPHPILRACFLVLPKKNPVDMV